MFKKNIYLAAYILLTVSVKAQNIVPNWSFEDTVHCPTNVAQITNSQFWYSPTANTPDYYNGCSFVVNVPYYGSGFQYAKDGQAYAGIFCYDTVWKNDREYVQVALKETLIKDRIYCAGFWVNLAEFVQYAVDKIGMFISANPISLSVPSFLPYIPQIESPSGVFLTDTLNWVLISGSFQAQGGEKYLTIGNFRDDTNTGHSVFNGHYGFGPISYYIIDAVFLYECDSAKIAEAGTDITICRDNSVVLGSSTLSGCKYKWTPASSLNIDTIAQPVASPQVTTTYYLTLTDPFYQITTDSVVVIVQNDCNNATVYIPNIFSPNSDGQNDVFLVHGENIETLNFAIYNRWGEKVFETQNKNEGWDGNYKGKPCSPDVYVYHATIMFKDGTETSRKGNVTLVR